MKIFSEFYFYLHKNQTGKFLLHVITCGHRSVRSFQPEPATQLATNKGSIVLKLVDGAKGNRFLRVDSFQLNRNLVNN